MLQENIGLDYLDIIMLVRALIETSTSTLVANSRFLPTFVIDAAKASLAANSKQSNSIKVTKD